MHDCKCWRLESIVSHAGFYALFFHLTKFKIMALPKEIRTDHYFMGSVFKNSECETILRNIVMLQKKGKPRSMDTVFVGWLQSILHTQCNRKRTRRFKRFHQRRQIRLEYKYLPIGWMAWLRRGKIFVHRQNDRYAFGALFYSFNGVELQVSRLSGV